MLRSHVCHFLLNGIVILDYFCSDWKPPLLGKAILLSILKVCHLWMIKDGIRYAIHHLESLNLGPFHMLQLATQYHIQQWVAPVITALMDILVTIASFGNNANHLGFGVYTLIVKVREMLEKERKLIAAYPPPLHSNTSQEAGRSWLCNNHASCRRAWKEVWWSVIAKDIPHPIKPLPLRDGITLLLATPFPGMADDCKGDQILKMTETGGLNRTEEKIIQGAIEAVLACHGFSHAV
jgi:hypothetical protein